MTHTITTEQHMSKQKPVTGIYKSINEETKKESLIKVTAWHESTWSDGWQATLDPAFCDAEDVMYSDKGIPFQHSGEATGFSSQTHNVTGEEMLVAVENMEYCTVMHLQK